MSRTCHPATHYLGALEPGQDAAEHINKLFEQGEGARVFLQPATTYELHSPLRLLHDGQELATANYPANDEWKATLLTVGSQADAIIALNRSHIRIRNIVIDGQEPKLGSSEHREPMILIGGPECKGATVQDCVLRHPRGWTALHVADFARNVKVIRNHVGPCGHPAPAGPWADGISYAGRDGLVSGNTIVDATDGAIVLFCAPGTMVSDNTVIARSRDLLGAINMVDAAPYESDYTNTRVFGNRIYSQGAYIKLGIGCGPLAWGEWSAIGAKGGFVEDNAILSGRLGYGFAAAGCADMTFKGNYVAPEVRFEGSTDKCDWNIAPAAFVRHNDDALASGEYQPEFKRGFIKTLVFVSPEVPTQARFYPGKILNAHTSQIRLHKATLQLKCDGALDLLSNQDGSILWSARSAHFKIVDAELQLTEEGHLQVWSDTIGQPLWDPLADLPCCKPSSDRSWLRDANLVIRDVEPYLTIQDSHENVLFSTSLTFPLNWSLDGGRFVTVPHAFQRPPPRSSAAPPPVPPRPGMQHPPFTWLYLCPFTSQIVLHTSDLPNQVDPSREIWRSKNWQLPPADEGVKPTKLALQGPDGMMVIYRAGNAVWASGSTQATQLQVSGQHQPGGARLDLVNDNGEVKWSSQQS